MRRAAGTGTIERRRNADGTESYRARIPTGRAGEKINGPWTSDKDEAKGWCLTLRDQLRDGEIKARPGVTLAEHWEAFVADLEALRKPRALHYRKAWRQHVHRYPLADMQLAEIRPADLRAFALKLMRARVDDGQRVIAPNTAKSVWTAVCAALSHATAAGAIEVNPALGLDLEWPEEQDDGELEYLEPHEIAALLACEKIPRASRLVVAIYLFTGMRAGEGVHMPLADLKRAHETGDLLIRYGSRGRKPKGGETRTVPLLDGAREAIGEWLALLPTFTPHNPHALAFPTATGSRRNSSAIVGRRHFTKGRESYFWPEYLAAAGCHRITWHGLRHTCGAALASGWWGRTWAMHEIRDFLGHATLDTTEQYYGHLAPSALKRAAEETRAVVPRSPAPLDLPTKTAKNPAWAACSANPVISRASLSSDALGTTAGLLADIDTRLLTRQYPTPDECRSIARRFLELDELGRLALAVVDAEPGFALSRLVDLLAHVSRSAPARARQGGAS